ncbi:hypothetical protein AWENTII_008544 [Aspergillus wentii]
MMLRTRLIPSHSMKSAGVSCGKGYLVIPRTLSLWRQHYLTYDSLREFTDPWHEMMRMGCTYFMHAPLKFESVEEILSCCSKVGLKTLRRLEKRNAFFTPEISLDIFSKLPIEIAHLLLSSLPSVDVCHLRLASRAIADRSLTKNLPQFFWKSRFLPELEMGFALPENIRKCEDWRELYFLLRHELGVHRGCGRVSNRRRVWQRIGKNTEAYELYVQDICLQGVSMSWDDARQFTGTGKTRPGKLIRTEIMDQYDKHVYTGSRELYTRRLLLRSMPQKIRSVGISTCIFNSRLYISGLRLLTQDGDNSAMLVSHSLGRVVTSTEHQLQLLPKESFAGFELATCETGIVGMRLIVEVGSRRYPSAWVGRDGSIDRDIAFGYLPVENDQYFIDLAAGFDAFKMIALAMVETQSFFDIPDAHTSAPESLDMKGLILQPLWMPCQPAKTVLLVPQPVFPSRQKYNVILNIDFGSTGVYNLDKLTRIVAHLGDSQPVFTGLMFEYDLNEPCLLFGKRSDIEISFLIDGPGGERISRVTCEQPDHEKASFWTGIWSIEFYTNFRRHIKLKPSGPPSVPEGSPSLDQLFTKHTLLAPEGQVITGLTSIIDVRRNGFQTLGLQCSRLSKAQTGDRKIIKNALKSAAEICLSDDITSLGDRGHRHCVGYTHASLDNVKCIRFSSGILTHPREPKEISGLWLEYFDSRPSEIVGQWFKEVDSMCLQPGEKVIELSIKLVTHPRYISISDTIRVVSVSILTSHMQSKTAQTMESTPSEGYIQMKARSNRLEELSGLAWVFNTKHDHPRVVLSSTTDLEHISLWDPTISCEKPQLRAPERVLWQEADQNGQPDPVVSVSARRSFIYTVKYITGLVFTYRSGATRTIGLTDGDAGREVSLEDYKKLSNLNLTQGERGLLEVSFGFPGLTGEDSRTTFHQLAGSDLDIPDGRGYLEHHYIDLYSKHKSHLIGLGSGRISFNDMPKKELLGLWGYIIDDNLTMGLIYSDKPRSDMAS